MQPRLFLKLADELAKAGGPAECRSAISRAYYAVFNAADLFLDSMGIVRPKGEYHIAVQRRLLGSNDAALVKLGSTLGDLHQERIYADYHLSDARSENKKAAEAAVLKGEKMIAMLDACAADPIRWTKAKDAMSRLIV